jgi:hypothetical protein
MSMMRPKPALLFSGQRIIDEAGKITEKVCQEISYASLQALECQSADDLVQALYTENEIELPTLRRDRAEHDHFESYIAPFIHPSQTFDARRVQDLRHGVVFALEVPFVGDGQYFHSRPTLYEMNMPLAAIGEHKLTLYVPALNSNREQVEAAFRQMLDRIEEKLGRLVESLKDWPMSFRSRVAGVISARLSKLAQAEQISEGLTFKPKRRPGSPDITVPLVRKRIRSSPILESAVPGQPAEQQHVLAEETYQHILSVMQNMSLVMEFSPKAFESLNEETIRFHFLVQLNGQYEGTATGETFNGEGKSDILIRQNNANLFIAECKIWEGPSALNDAIGQLQKYITWRDTKVALVVFNRNRGFSDVIQRAQEVLRSHPQYRAGPISEGETRFRYAFTNAADKSRDFVLTLMLFNLPSPK